MAYRLSAHGTYLWRGGEKLPVRRSEHSFTVIPTHPSELTTIGQMEGVVSVQRLLPYVYHVKTDDKEKCDILMGQIRKGYLPSIVYHVYKLEGSSTTFFITDKLFIGFRPGTDIETIERLFNFWKLHLISTKPGDPPVCVVQVTIQSGVNPLKVANCLMKEDCIEYAEPNLVNIIRPASSLADELFPKRWHLHVNRRQVNLVKEASIDITTAWSVTKGKRDVVIAVLDAGFNLQHPGFQGKDKIKRISDYEMDIKPPQGHDLAICHGTACAAAALAEKNEHGVIGAAPGCSFLPITMPWVIDDYRLISTFSAIDNLADVISCSWGPSPSYATLCTPLSRLFTRLAKEGGPLGKGSVICFAAGNDNVPLSERNNEQGFPYLDSQGNLQTATGPLFNGFANHPDVLTVAASTSLGRHADYSNWGKAVNVCAPGSNFHPYDRRQFVPGLAVWTLGNEPAGFTPRSHFTHRCSGTSMAAPIVAGLVGLMRSANPNLNAKDIRQILEKTAHKLVDSHPDVRGDHYGDYDEYGHSLWFGYGRVNAGKAVKMALDLL